MAGYSPKAKICTLAAYKRAWSHCGSVTLEGKQHLVVFLHSRAASLRALRGICEPASLSAKRTGPSSKRDRNSKGKKKRHSHTGCRFSLEVQAGFEPADNGVADRGLTTWLLHQTDLYFDIIANLFWFVNRKKDNLSKEFVKKF